MDLLILNILVMSTVTMVLIGLRKAPPFIKRIVGSLAIVFLLLFWTPAVYMMNRVLEAPYEQGDPHDREVQAIVVLAGTVFSPEPERPVPLLGSDTYERCFYAAWLYRHWKHVPIVASGGPATGSFAATMQEMIVSEGVPADMVWTEDRSENTHQNAVYVTEMLRRKNIQRIALVTEAYHMRRADGCFRRLGMNVVVAPCGFRARYQFRVSTLFFSAFTFNQGLDALHEAIGLAWYVINGRI